MIEADASVQPLLRSLLGRTLIVPDLAAATSAWRETHGAYDFVTASGELLSRHGVYTGGSASTSGKAPSSILGRKNQIAELEGQLEQAQEQVNDLSRRKGALLSEQTALQASLQQAQTELRVQEVAIATRQGEFNALQNSQKLLHQKIDTVVYEIQSLAAQEQEGRQKRAGLAAQVGELKLARARPAAAGDANYRVAGGFASATRPRDGWLDGNKGGAGVGGADLRFVPSAAVVAATAVAGVCAIGRTAAR